VIVRLEIWFILWYNVYVRSKTKTKTKAPADRVRRGKEDEMKPVDIEILDPTVK